MAAPTMDPNAAEPPLGGGVEALFEEFDDPRVDRTPTTAWRMHAHARARARVRPERSVICTFWVDIYP